MKKFFVYRKISGRASSEDFYFVGDRFNIWAFLFNIFWLLAKKLWEYFFVVLFLLVGLEYVSSTGIISQYASFVISFVIKFLLACEAPFLLERKLLKQGYELESIIYSDSEKEARVKFFENEFV